MDRPAAENDIKMIRDIMERSTKYTHFTGLSGVLSGLFALAGSYATFWIYVYVPTSEQAIWTLATWALVFILAVVVDFALAARDAKKQGTTILNPASKQVILAVLPGVFAAFIIAFAVLIYAPSDLIPGILAIGYGSALCSAGMFSTKEVRIYGLVQLVTGTIALLFFSKLPYSLFTMAVCFGLYQILFGIWVAVKCRR